MNKLLEAKLKGPADSEQRPHLGKATEGWVWITEKRKPICSEMWMKWLGREK